MSKLLKSTMIGLMIAGFTGCAQNTSDIEVIALKSEKVNLDGYKTYQIIDQSGFVQDPKATPIPTNLDVSAEIQQIVNAELAKKGKMPVTANPDFYVAYLAAADMDAIKEKVDKEGKMTIENAPDAAMLLTLIDANTAEIIYISSAEGDVKGLPADQMKQRLNYAIKKMLGNM